MSVGSAGESGGNWQRARPLRVWGVCCKRTSAGCRLGHLWIVWSRRPRLGARHVCNWIDPGAVGDCRWR
eukprot:1144376-Rhodomonas_salina.1